MKTSPVYLALFALCLAGCGSAYSVRGKVMYEDGGPFVGGWIFFEKTDGDKTVEADSPINPDGSFELRRASPGDGVPAGTYRVKIKPPERILPADRALPPVLDPRFLRFETSGLERVVEAKANFFEIKVSRP
jgi:hypothetical protein